ncbi:MAG: PAN domain-containing protein [Hyphomicrobiaceae bacterium]|nr:PAN domain-containing protein [Hyphomicrobiaceae bacterium]
MILLFSATNADAANQNLVIVGEDFAYLDTPNAEACRRACESARLCVAWTFLHRRRQCRLKSAVYDERYNSCCTSGVVDRARLDRPRPKRRRQRITMCRANFNFNGMGWRQHRWRFSDCTNGLPPLNSYAIGQAKNGNGTGGQADCTQQFGKHYNHPKLHGATTGEVVCLYVSR